MKKSILFHAFILIIAVACNNNQQAHTSADSDSTAPDKDTIHSLSPADSSTASADANRHPVKNDSTVIPVARIVLDLLDKKDYTGFAAHIHPTQGIRFSPYGYIDTTQDLRLSRKEFLEKLSGKSVLVWGTTDGEGSPIRLSVQKYFDRFVYDKPFARPEKFSLNEFLGMGNSMNNLSAIYPGTQFTESYFSGFDKKLEGMDWRTLRLIFRKDGNQYFLVGIVHDQWTI